MESKKGGGVLLVLAEVRLGTRSFFFFLFLKFILPEWLREGREERREVLLHKVAQKCAGAGVTQKVSRAERLESMGGPCCYPRSNKGREHRPTHALSVGACTHL